MSKWSFVRRCLLVATFRRSSQGSDFSFKFLVLWFCLHYNVKDSIHSKLYDLHILMFLDLHNQAPFPWPSIRILLYALGMFIFFQASATLQCPFKNSFWTIIIWSRKKLYDAKLVSTVKPYQLCFGNLFCLYAFRAEKSFHLIICLSLLFPSLQHIQSTKTFFFIFWKDLFYYNLYALTE